MVTLVFLFTVMALAARAQGTIVANVSNFENNNGVCRACLFNTAAAFAGKGQPVQCTLAPVAGLKAQLVFNNVPPGTYAVSVFHDANNNNQLDKNFLGIPKEGYGASKNDLPFASAPSFNGNKFEIKANTTTTLFIKLRNL